MPLDFDFFSRFNRTPPTIHNERETFGVWVQPDFLTRQLLDSEINTIVVDNRLSGRPDEISRKFYGTTLLDWAIIAFNAPRDPLNWPRPGDVIKLPLREVIMPELG